MARIDILAKRLAEQIDSVIEQRLGKIGNPVIRKAIEESLRDQVYENIGDLVSGEIEKVVDESMKDIINSIQGIQAKKKNRAAASKISRSFGGKSGSGAKYSPPTRSSGAKSSGAKASNKNVPRPASGGKSGRRFGGK